MKPQISCRASYIGSLAMSAHTLKPRKRSWTPTSHTKVSLGLLGFHQLSQCGSLSFCHSYEIPALTEASCQDLFNHLIS